MGQMLDDTETYAVIGAAMEVHRVLGSGFLEAVYHEALAIELAAREVPHRREVRLPIRYKRAPLGTRYQADFLCYEGLLLELKAIDALASARRLQYNAFSAHHPPHPCHLWKTLAIYNKQGVRLDKLVALRHNHPMFAPPDQSDSSTLNAPGLGASQRAILDALKRHGRATTPELSAELRLNIETVRDHLRALAGHGLVARVGKTGGRRGRPEIVYGLLPAAEALFPRQEGVVLQGLAEFLRETGNESVIRDYFDRVIGARRAEALARVEHLAGRARLDEVARIMTELGFMATVDEGAGVPRLRLCHCPIRDLVHATRVPCRAEIGFVSELLGESLARERYIPAGDESCTYSAEGPAC